MVWLSEIEKNMMIRLAVSTEYWRMTDRWTDEQTDIFRHNSLRNKVLEAVVVTSALDYM